jgi:hypothetical protein
LNQPITCIRQYERVSHHLFRAQIAELAQGSHTGQAIANHIRRHAMRNGYCTEHRHSHNHSPHVKTALFHIHSFHDVFPAPASITPSLYTKPACEIHA